VLGTDCCHKDLCAAETATQSGIKEALTFGWKKLTIAEGIRVIASQAKQSSASGANSGLLRRFASRNDE
jgi:hypothetical protein